MSDIQNAAPAVLEAGITHINRISPPLNADTVKSFVKQYKEGEWPHWMNEDIFKLLEEAKFERTIQCCEGVKLKLCATDQWQGGMDGLFKRIEIEVRKKIIREIEDAFKPVE